MPFFLAPLLAGAAKAALGAAATAGASALASKVAGGGKRGYQQTGTQTVKQEIDYVKMRENAEAAGLNFLTAAKGGGGAGFVQTHNPILSTREVSGVRQGLADGLVAGVRAAFDYDPLQEQKAQIEYDIMKSQLRNLNAQNSYYTRLGSNLQSRGRTVVTSGAKLKAGSPELAKQPPYGKGDVKVTNPYPFGLQSNPYVADGATFEERNGEFVGSLFGGLVTAADAGWNIYRGANAAFDVIRRPVPNGRLSNYGVGPLAPRKPNYIHKSNHGRVHRSGLATGW